VFCNISAISKYFAAHTEYRPTCASVGGGWRRIAHFNMSVGDDCSSG